MIFSCNYLYFLVCDNYSEKTAYKMQLFLIYDFELQNKVNMNINYHYLVVANFSDVM